MQFFPFPSSSFLTGSQNPSNLWVPPGKALSSVFCMQEQRLTAWDVPVTGLERRTHEALGGISLICYWTGDESISFGIPRVHLVAPVEGAGLSLSSWLPRQLIQELEFSPSTLDAEQVQRLWMVTFSKSKIPEISLGWDSELKVLHSNKCCELGLFWNAERVHQMQCLPCLSWGVKRAQHFPERKSVLHALMKTKRVFF